MNPIWFLRMERWIRHPPSSARVRLVVGVVVVCLLLVAVEHVFGWPDWLTTQGGGRALRP